ncbi:L,D-transpeptidase family protein [Halobacillus sp. B23F22_1]|uniref:L,D-transpeptidase family protein n=1 Tax=Halobacillus sp. B23F22_1 TaxID=3459514 RepID=UPI00373EF22D
MIHTIKTGETLSQISRDYRTPLPLLIQANPTIDPDMIYPGQTITIPGLPEPDTLPYTIDISINNRQLKLLKDGAVVKQYPIAVGRMLHGTPVGDFVIINKAPDPGGPYGTMWMSLSKQYYGIHGTNDPSSIGKAVSLGCVRMYNEDVEELAQTIPIGTRVSIHP